MTFRSISQAQDGITPLHPEDKCSSRKRCRPVTTTTTTTPRDLSEAVDDELVHEAALFDFDFIDTEEHVHLKRLCCHAKETEQKLSEEVKSLQDSVNSMARDVAKAADKINELRYLVTLYMKERQNAATH